MATIKVKEGIEIYPAGLYHLRVKNITVQEAKYGDNAGNQFLSWEDEILDAQEESHIGESYKHTTPLNISPRSKYFPLLEVLGVTIPDGVKEIEYDTDDFIGQEFIASVKVSKITQGRNTGGEKNEFAQLWTPEDFTAQQEKANKISSKFNKNAQQVSTTSSVAKSNSVKEKASEESPTETVKAPPISKRGNILQGSSLADFPD